MSVLVRTWRWIRPPKVDESVKDDNSVLLPRVWARWRPINYPKLIEMTGGFAAPLLAGFSLTTVAQLVIGTNHPWLSGYAIALFATAAVLLVNTVQFSATALSYAATPSERLDYNPEAAAKEAVLHKVRERQWQDMDLRVKYTSRAAACYNFGLLAFLGGLGLILVPQHRWPWPWGQFVGVVAVGISLAIEGVWILSNAQRPRWLLPTSSKNTPNVLPLDGAEYLYPSMASDGIVKSLEKCVELLEKIARK